jgi:hypothetical protein
MMWASVGLEKVLERIKESITNILDYYELEEHKQ